MADKILNLTEANAIKAYQEGNADQRALLIRLYGQEVFNRKITDRVKSMQDVCEVLGIDYKTLVLSIENLEEDEQAYIQLKLVVKALNEGWTPNWDNSSEYKYYPYFDMRSSAGFSDVHYDYWCSYSYVGSRLCFRSRELAEHAVKHFKPLYKKFFII